MKLFIFLIGLISIMGCTSVAKKEVTDKYIGKTGYFSLAPRFVTILGTKHEVNKDEILYRPCDAVKITGVRTMGHAWFIDFIQNGKEFTTVWDDFNMGSTVPFLENHFVPELKISTKKILLKDKKSTTVRDLLCSGSIFTDMSKEELYFLKGSPDSVNTQTSKSGSLEQLVYKKKSDPYGVRADYYYIKDGLLSSWQN